MSLEGCCHGRLNALFFSLDCKPNCKESQAKSKYRDDHNAPLPGAAGDLSRSCDEQLLDAFLAIKRILDERALLIERHDRESERNESSGSVYDVSTDDEGERLEGLESPAQENGSSSGDVEEATSEGHMSDDDASAPPAAVTGGNDCGQSSDQQGHVLPFDHDPNLICQTEGCNRRRRRYFEHGYTRYRWRIGTYCC